MGIELLPLSNVHRENLMFQRGLFEENGNLEAIGCGPAVQFDHDVLLAALSRI
jgi:hypothetical protein